jgi:hypothetical protein
MSASQPILQRTASSLKPKLLDQVRQAIRARHYSKRTEKSYVDWIKVLLSFLAISCWAATVSQRRPEGEKGAL